MEALQALAVYLIAWLLVTSLYRGRRGNLEVTPLAILYRFGARMEPMRGRLSRGISIAGYASVVVAYGLMMLFYYLIVSTFWVRYLIRPPGASGLGVVPLIPGVTVPLSVLPHVLVALGVAAAVHELAHALAARAEGLPVKSVGVALFVFIPAAFVEIDEEQLKKAPLKSRLKVYSAGVTANLLLYLALVGLSGALPCSIVSQGVSIIDVTEGSPAANALTTLGVPANLSRGDVIVGVNGERVYCIQQLAIALEKAGVKDPSREVNLTLEVVRGDTLLDVVIHKPVNETRIGVTIINKYTTVGLLLYSSIMLNIALALVNAGPLFITDGAKMLDEPLEILGGRMGRTISLGLQAATLLLIVSLVTIQPILPG